MTRFQVALFYYSFNLKNLCVLLKRGIGLISDMKCYTKSLETNYFIMLKIPYMLKVRMECMTIKDTV
jgi:hypothetical protein